MKSHFFECKVVRAKVSDFLKKDFLKKKTQAMSPCYAEVWWDAIKDLGIENSKSYGGLDRDGFLRVTDPVGVHFPSESCTRHGVLYIPYDLVEKILVFGGLP